VTFPLILNVLISSHKTMATGIPLTETDSDMSDEMSIFMIDEEGVPQTDFETGFSQLEGRHRRGRILYHTVLSGGEQFY
jgi:hypothetical protein